MDARNSEVGATLAPLTFRSWTRILYNNGPCKNVQPLLFIYFLECKVTQRPSKIVVSFSSDGDK